MYSNKHEESNDNYDQQETPKVLASVQFPIVNGTIVNGTHKIGQKQFSLVNCIPTSWVRYIFFFQNFQTQHCSLLKLVLFIFIIRLLVQAKIAVNKVAQPEH